MMLTVREFFRRNEDKHLAEIKELQAKLAKFKAEISELKSQVEDLNEELGNVLDVKNRQAWEIRLLKEEIKRLKRIKAEDRED